MSFKNFWRTLVVTFLLNGGLNQVTFLARFLFETGSLFLLPSTYFLPTFTYFVLPAFYMYVLLLRTRTSCVMLHLCTIKALRESGYTNDVEYVEGRKNKEPVLKSKHARKVTCFNPPFSKNITTRVGQKFLNLIDKHFPVGSKLRKVFKWNTVKVSYSCMPSVGSIIKQHNARICGAGQENGNQPRCCNCCKPEQCSLNGHCLTNKIVYKATVETDSTSAPKIYVGSTETCFKQRYANHLMSFRHEKYEN